MESRKVGYGSKRLRRDLFWVKSTYFLFIGGRSVFVSFVVVFLASIGLNPKEIGLIRGIQSLIFFIVSPATGILSDRFDIHKPVLLLGISGMSICYSSIALLSKYYSDLNENLYATVIVNRTKAPFHEDNLLDYEDYSNKKFLTFGGSLLLVSLGEICYAGVPPLLDSNTQTLVRMTSRCSFGQQRFWGSVGSIVLLTVTGYMLNIVNQNFTLCYEFIPAFLVFILCEFLCLIPAWFIPLFPQESRDKFLRAHLCEKFRHPRFAMILLVAFVLGMTSTQDTFKYLLLAELDASHLNRSLCIVFNCLGELPVMWYSKRFLKLLGNENAICFVTFVWIIRLGLYCVITNPWLILPVEFLHGVCHGLWSPALTSFCREISLTKIAVSVLAVANGVHTGIGVAAGNLGGGLVYNACGPRVLFGGLACINTILLGVYAIFLRLNSSERNATPIERKEDGKLSEATAHYSAVVLYKVTYV